MGVSISAERLTDYGQPITSTKKEASFLMRKTILLITLLSMPFILMAQTKTKPMAIQMAPAQMKWGPAPPGLPPGAEVAILSGDPSKDGKPFVLRLKVPSGYKVMPHYHPKAEHLTVISGTFFFGMGDKFDMKAGHAYGVGSYLNAPAEMHHYAWAKGSTVVQVHGIGPFAITYVNPADDPRKSAQPKTK
jgi:hypothetical protein